MCEGCIKESFAHSRLSLSTYSHSRFFYVTAAVAPSGRLLASRARMAYSLGMSSSQLNLRQEAFCRLLAEGRSQKNAYVEAGYLATGNAAEVAAARLFRNVQVAARLTELRAKAARRHEVTVDSLIEELEQMRLWAIECRHPAAGVSAIMGKAKLLGLVIDKTEISGSIRKPSRTPTADRQITIEEWKRRFAPKLEDGC